MIDLFGSQSISRGRDQCDTSHTCRSAPGLAQCSGAGTKDVGSRRACGSLVGKNRASSSLLIFFPSVKEVGDT